MPYPELVPQLRMYLDSGVLRHPLVYEDGYHPRLNASYNERYESKAREVRRALEDRDWGAYVSKHQLPYQLEALAEVGWEIEDAEYWRLFGRIWIESENLWQYGDDLEEILTSGRPGCEHMMDEHEREFLSGLPDRFAVYRGHAGLNRLGHSWTLSPGRARWFANRFGEERTGVLAAVADKRAARAVFLGRGEFEVAVRPADLDRVRPLRSIRRPAWLREVAEQARSSFALGERSPHGPWHWEQVERNALALARETPGCDVEVARLFAVIHDSRRADERDDPDHGRRAAAFAEALHREGKLDLTPRQLATLAEACALHADGEVTADPTVGVCWDADRLDLSRVGAVPDPRLLSTDAARRLLWQL